MDSYNFFHEAWIFHTKIDKAPQVEKLSSKEKIEGGEIVEMGEPLEMEYLVEDGGNLN